MDYSNIMLKAVLLFNYITFCLARITPIGQLPQFDERIIGGKDPTIDMFAWQVSLQKGNSEFSHFCGGSLYRKNIVITAAHCVFNSNSARLKVRIGSTTHDKGGQLVNVSAFKIHERYNPFTMINDIAILRLGVPVTLGRKVKAIKLATKPPSDGTKAAVTGWGTTAHGDVLLPGNLKTVTVKIISNEECGSTTYGYGEFIKTFMICAYAQDKDACQGDSGGPLVANGYLVGVVSWGEGCALLKYPGVYSDVAYFNSWIHKTVDNLLAY